MAREFAGDFMMRMVEQLRTSIISRITDTRRPMRMIGIGRNLLHASLLDNSKRENEMKLSSQTPLLHFQEYISGWLDSSVHDFLDLFPVGSTSTAYALITCLDSNLEPKSLLNRNPELKAALHGVRFLNGGLLIPSRVLRDSMTRHQLFVGFDEIWFFPSDNIEPKPKSTWIVGPSRIDQSLLDNLGRWMKKNNCSLALGDGDGLNVIAKARGMMKYLMALSMSQRKPALEGRHVLIQDEQ